MSVLDKIKTVALEEAENKFKNYNYYLIYRISTVDFGRTEDLTQLKPDDIQEAYFFDVKGQMHLYYEEGILEARELYDADLKEIHYLDRKYELKNRFFIDGKKSVLVREYLNFDEDGQVNVVYTRLVGPE